MNIKRFTAIAFVLFTIGFVVACQPDSQPAPDKKTEQSTKAKQAAESIVFSGNAEIDNIKRRLELTSDPALLGYVLLFNDVGNPVMYTSVKGKITSGGKRLTRPTMVVKRWDCGEYTCNHEVDAPSDEGTWGSSSPYIYFWNQAGQYIQWNGKYMYSDKPFRVDSNVLSVSID